MHTWRLHSRQKTGKRPAWDEMTLLVHPWSGGCTEEALSEWPSMLYLGGGCNTMWGCFIVYCEHCSITLNRNAVHEDVSASSPWTICLLQLIWLKSGKRAFIRFYVVISRSSFSLRLRLRAAFSSPFWLPLLRLLRKTLGAWGWPSLMWLYATEGEG